MSGHYKQIAEEVLPSISHQRTHTPIYQWLRGAGMLDDEGELRPDATVTPLGYVRACVLE